MTFDLTPYERGSIAVRVVKVGWGPQGVPTVQVQLRFWNDKERSLIDAATFTLKPGQCAICHDVQIRMRLPELPPGPEVDE